jgi:hypothetical protein
MGAVGMAVTGRQDLPTVFRFVGTQLGRVVGVLQGARARVDQYAAQNELRQLQNELRSGLRELDQVRMELAVAASSQGMMGRTLGVTTPSANRLSSLASSSSTTSPPLLTGATSSASTMGVTGTPSMMTMMTNTTTTTNTTGSTLPLAPSSGMTSGFVPGGSTLSTMTTTGSAGLATSLEGTYIESSVPGSNNSSFNNPILTSTTTTTIASSASHSEKAALEDEWEKQGIGYQTRAEQWYKEQRQRRQGGTPLPASGSELLEALIKQNLLWDQYDRVVGEQDLQLQQRMATIQQQQQQQQQTLIQEIDEDETKTIKKE